MSFESKLLDFQKEMKAGSKYKLSKKQAYIHDD